MKLRYAIPTLLMLLIPSMQAWSENTDQISFENYVSPLFPYGLAYEGIFDGYVDIAVDVNEDGTIADWLVLRTTHKVFTREIERVIGKWSFTPAVRDGNPIPIIYEIQFRFTHNGVTVISGDLTQLYLNRIQARSADSRVVFELADLDKIPIPVEVIHPMAIEGLSKEEFSGRIVVEFIIDEAGKVRMPVVREIDGPMDLAHSAYAAILRWKFEPPVRKGKIVYARARQPFIFSPDK